MLLHQPIDYHAERRPTHAALSAHDFNWDYTTLVARSHAVARLLLDAGVKAEDRIGVLASIRQPISPCYWAPAGSAR